MINGQRSFDINKIIENAVYNHLVFLNYKVNIGQLNDKEIDFVAEKGNELVYFQVAYLLPDEKVIAREFGNLDKIDDHFPKYVVTMDEFFFNASYKGIKHIQLIDFLNQSKF